MKLCVETFDGYICTLSSGHEGLHIAKDHDDRIVRTWSPEVSKPHVPYRANPEDRVLHLSESEARAIYETSKHQAFGHHEDGLRMAALLDRISEWLKDAAAS